MPATGKGGAVDHSLPPGKSLTIGYGSGGARPRRYGVRAGRDVEIGILKLFLSTKFVNYSSLEQPSPFSEGRTDDTPCEDDVPDLWCEKTIVLVQRRGKSP